ncbi:VanZ family protein [Paenisporosarcina cavernae]|uniref:VanZ family protein n=1 Tax=Paenisporosarcina cavernae TaxID=2320858 RepID=A0A385YWI8_9BACL|nr:VanZ family protein [Paenisporosarcina cavernae]AYC30267.1 VanZ family protein [Paenisporosarcina cavernae]
MHIILSYLSSMGLYMLLVLPIVAIYRYIIWKKRHRQVKLLREIGIYAFLLFLIGLLSQTIFPKISYSGTTIFMSNGHHQAINTEPFRVIVETYNAIKYLNLWEPFFINFLGNILMFIPIGFFVALLSRKGEHFFVNIATGFLLSLSIELLQLPQMRSSDVDDLWLNTLGTMIGWAIIPIIPETVRERFKR